MTTVALAGRRIDAADADTARFPLENRDMVEQRLLDWFRAGRPDRLVASAACGADLLALAAAEQAGVPRCTVVLPFPPDRFLEVSVADRPGDWTALYRAQIDRARAAGELIVLGLTEADDAYDRATKRILLEAERTAPVTACIVWEGGDRGDGDHSLGLARMATARGWPVSFILTL